MNKVIALSKLFFVCVCVFSICLMSINMQSMRLYSISFSHRLRQLHCRWGNMLAMDQGVVEEWLSEFKVLLFFACTCVYKKNTLKSTYPTTHKPTLSELIHYQGTALTQAWAITHTWLLLKLWLGQGVLIDVQTFLCECVRTNFLSPLRAVDF